MRRIHFVFLLFVVVSCSMEGITEPSVHPATIRDYYLPYIDSAVVPTEAEQWSDAKITLSLSAAEPSGILLGIDDAYFAGANFIEVLGNDMWVRPWIYDVPRTGSVSDQVSLLIPAVPAGNYTVYIQTADSIESSAVHAQVEGNFFTAPEPEGTHYMEFPLTVLPAEYPTE